MSEKNNPKEWELGFSCYFILPILRLYVTILYIFKIHSQDEVLIWLKRVEKRSQVGLFLQLKGQQIRKCLKPPPS